MMQSIIAGVQASLSKGPCQAAGLMGHQGLTGTGAGIDRTLLFLPSILFGFWLQSPGVSLSHYTPVPGENCQCRILEVSETT